MAYYQIMDYGSLSRDELEKELDSLRCRNSSMLSLLSTLKDGIITVNRQGEILYLNKTAEELTGWPLEEAAGKPCAEVLNLVDHFSSDPIYLDLQDFRQEGRIKKYSGYLDILDKKQTAHHVSIRLLPFKGICPDSDMVINIQDITETRHLREEINRIQKLDALSKLAGGIAHSFNNMLTGIMGFSELMTRELDENKDPDLFAYNQVIMETCERASDVTGELLKFSRKRNLGCVEINLNEQIESAITQLKPFLGAKITLDWEMRSPSCLINADPFQIREIIINLGKNARDALREGGKIVIKTKNRHFNDEECRRKSRLMKPGEYYIISFYDSGPGINAEVLPHIFDPFYTTKPVYGGSGLGLSAVYGSVISHGGTISVKTKEGKGTCFEIALPLNSQNCFF